MKFETKAFTAILLRLSFYVILTTSASSCKAIYMRIDFLKDARYFQIFFQLIFLGYGILFLHWNAEWWLYVTYFLVSICTQAVCEMAFNKRRSENFFLVWWMKLKRGIPSALITALG